MELSDVANLLAYIGAKLTYRAGLNRVTVDDITVKAWKADLDHGHCHHLHIAVKAVDDHFRSPAGQFGITPGELVNAYNTLAARIIAAAEDREPLTPPDDVATYLAERRRNRRAILANPANLAAIGTPARPQLPPAPSAPDPKLMAAIRAATPRPAKRLEKLDEQRMAEARAEIDRLRTQLATLEGELS